MAYKLFSVLGPFFFLLATLISPIPASGQAATLALTIAAPSSFDLLAGGDHPTVTCIEQSFPFSSVSQEIVAVSSGLYEADITVSSEGNYLCSIAPIDGLNTNDYITVQAVNGQVATGTLNLTAYDADITLHLVTQNGGNYVPLPVPSDSAGALAFCMDSDFNYTYSATLKPGDSTATVKLPGGMGYYCQVIGINNYGTDSPYFTVNQNGHLSWQAVMVPFDASANIHLVDQDGQPLLTSTPTFVYCGSAEVPFSFPPVQIQAGQSVATISLTGGHSYTCNTFSVPGYAAIYNATFFLASAETGKNANLPLAALNEHLIVQLRKADGNPYQVAAEDYAYVNCQGPNSLSFFQAFSNGESSADVKVLYGNYSCHASLSGHAAGSGSVTVPVGSTATLSLSVIERSGSARLYLQDQNEAPLTILSNIDFSVWPRYAGITDWSWGSLADGEALVHVAPDVPYLARVFPGAGSSSFAKKGPDQNHYLFPGKSIDFRAQAAELKHVPVTVYKTDA